MRHVKDGERGSRNTCAELKWGLVLHTRHLERARIRSDFEQAIEQALSKLNNPT